MNLKVYLKKTARESRLLFIFKEMLYLCFLLDDK